ncbi:hypothetical protein GCM10010424_29110 [Streptomyces lienomycini]
MGTPRAGVGTLVHMDVREERTMRAYDAPSAGWLSGRLSDGHGNVTPGTYNPHGGGRVQLAWQRFSNSPQGHGAPLCARPSHPLGRPVPVWPVRPVACR